MGLFAVVPAVILTFAWGGIMTRLLPVMSGKAAWDTVSTGGSKVIAMAREGAPSARDTAVINEHERALANATTRSRQYELITERAPTALMVASLLVVGLLSFLAARVAGHLTRQMSRPLDELVAWAGRIGRGEPLPPVEAKGAPEFGVLRAGMRQMAADIEAGKRATVEAERLSAMRETARQVAHELKNPLTPIRFAVARLKGNVPPELAESVSVLDAESARLDRMARSFAQFGRLPDGPVAEVDVAELVASAVRASVPEQAQLTVTVEAGLSLMGRHEALSRAIANVLVNAFEACGASGQLAVNARADGSNIVITVRDNGPGIDPSKLQAIWEPYVTHKAGGTGLGLAIVRQTVEAHGGNVSAESTPGAGTIVTLVLPKADHQRFAGQSMSKQEPGEAPSSDAR